jgi:UDP-N-acetylglucosamine 2-epimerase
MTDKKVLTVVGARPQFVKAAVISRRLAELGRGAPFREVLVHTGQHYDVAMSDVFFQELGMPEPRHHLGVGSAAPHRQLAAVLQGVGEVIGTERPDALLVYGDTNSTLGAALAAVHAGVPVVHAEAGERIYRRAQVPEETNRVLTDNAASLCLTSTRRAERYLLREGMSPERVRFVGDPMYDLFQWAVPRVRAAASASPAAFGVEAGGYALSTIHRVQNTSSPDVLLPLLETLDQAPLPVLLPVHPRVWDLLREWGWSPTGRLKLIGPQGYFDFLRLLLDCAICVTDSGGVTREAYFARRPCVVPMENCWWPEVVEAGWAVESGTSRERILEALERFPAPVEYPEGLFGDGDAATRVVDEVGALVQRGGEGAWHRMGTFDTLPRSEPTALTHAGYGRLLDRFRYAGYHFRSFPEAGAAAAEGERFVLMRHDIDFDIGAAVPIAEAEAERAVRATYFFMLRTEHYNVLSADGTAMVRRILELGHHLGLHFDCASYPAGWTPGELAAAVGREARLLGDWFGRPVEIVSFHRPDARVLAGDPAVSAPLPHTNLPELTRETTNFSDSRGHWPHGDPTASEAFDQGRPLHVVTDPHWWRERPTHAFQVLLELLDERTAVLDRSTAANWAVGTCHDQRGRFMAESVV